MKKIKKVKRIKETKASKKIFARHEGVLTFFYTFYAKTKLYLIIVVTQYEQKMH